MRSRISSRVLSSSTFPTTNKRLSHPVIVPPFSAGLSFCCKEMPNGYASVLTPEYITANLHPSSLTPLLLPPPCYTARQKGGAFVSAKSVSVVLTNEEVLILCSLISDRVSAIHPPNGRKGTKKIRSLLRTYDAILSKLRDASPALALAHRLSLE